MDLDITVTGSADERTVVLSGGCDLATAPELREALKPLVPPDVTTVTVVLTELEYLSSIGIGVLLGAARRLRQGGGRLVLTDPRPAVRLLLDATGVAEVLGLS